MSRETNSLLLRYGLNTFWSSSIGLSKLLYIKFQFNSFFVLFLRNYFLRALKIQYNFHLICLYVFQFKEDRFSFIYKFLKLKKTVINFLFCRKSYGLYMIDKRKNKKKKSSLVIHKLIFLLYKIMISNIYYFFGTKKWIMYKNFNSKIGYNMSYKYKSLFFCKKLYSTKKRCFLRRNISKYPFFWYWRINFINNLIKFKWLGLFSAFLIYTYTNKNFKVSLKSVTENMKMAIFPYTFKYFRNYFLRQKYYLIILSFIFLKASILNSYINILLKKIKNKKHIKTLIIFFNNLKIFFDKQFLPLLGLKFKISGRLNGKLRKGSFGFKLGSIRLMSLNLLLDYSCESMYTQYGSFSLKLWLCNTNEYNFI